MASAIGFQHQLLTKREQSLLEMELVHEGFFAMWTTIRLRMPAGDALFSGQNSIGQLTRIATRIIGG